MHTLVNALPKLPTAAEMRIWDQNAIAFGIPEIMLMENAANAIFQLLEILKGPVSGKNVLLFMGGGNNGGDCACLARYLLADHARPLVLHAKKLEELKGACATHTQWARNTGVKFKAIPETGDDRQCSTEFSLSPLLPSDFIPDIIIDGLLGTGFHGQADNRMRQIINMLNTLARQTGAFVLSIDIPSGLDAQTGLPSPVAVLAQSTITLAAPKPGIILPHAKNYTGSLFSRPIGIPPSVLKTAPSDMRLLDGRCLLNNDPLPGESYKNTYGHVLVLGGQGGTAGAAHLAAAGALRMGAGLVTAAVPQASTGMVKSGWPEIMTLPLGNGNMWPQEISQDLKKTICSMSALVIGPGMGRHEDARRFLYEVLALADRPAAMLDADALYHIGQCPELATLISSRDILTPHPGEAAGLLHTDGAEVQVNRPYALERLCDMYRGVIILKGAGTLIGQKNAHIVLCPYDVPQMAIGGAGDVLAGCLGALMAGMRDASALDIACMGVMRHVVAGLILSQKYPQRGALASDLANALSATDEFLQRQDIKNMYLGLTPWP